MTKLAIFNLVLIVVSIAYQGVNSVERTRMIFTSSDEGIDEPGAQTAIVPYNIPASSGDIAEARKTGQIKHWDMEEETEREIEETIDVSRSSQYIEGIPQYTKLRILFGDFPENIQLCIAFKEGTYGYDVSLKLVMITDRMTFTKTLSGNFPRKTAVVLTRQQTRRKRTSLFQRFSPGMEEETDPKPHYTSVVVLAQLLSKATFRAKLLLCSVNSDNKVDKLSQKAEIKFFG